MPKERIIKPLPPIDPNRVVKPFRAPVTVAGVYDFGTWDALVWNNGGVAQHGLRLTPTLAPWRGLFSALDQIGAGYSDAPVSALDEADAIVAACWRYGSFANVWTSGESFPEFRHNDQLSRFGDEEMKRVNLEFSSGLAQWWLTRAQDSSSANRRVRAALTTLEMPWRAKRGQGGAQLVEHHAAALVAKHFATLGSGQKISAGDTNPDSVRREANHTVALAYRNGAIEDLHAGTWSRGSEIPGYLRLTPAETLAVTSQIAQRLSLRLGIRELVNRDQLRDILESDWYYPRDWSVTEETSAIQFRGLPNAGPLEGRLEQLAKHAPAVYTSRA